jgi:GNAT superfamily N-acetyltransferase
VRPTAGDVLHKPFIDGAAGHRVYSAASHRLHTDNIGGEMQGDTLTHRIARREDLEALKALMNAAIGELQKPFLDEKQIASSRAIMGLDTQLIDDGTYFVVESDGRPAGCGGWSRRATLYGSDQTPGRSAALLDPARDAARVRAMYTHPDHVRKGVGRLILTLCQEAARSEGFRRMELMATLAGEPLYRACGYLPLERVEDDRGGAAVPLLRMYNSI